MKKLPLVIIVLLILISAGGGYYWYRTRGSGIEVVNSSPTPAMNEVDAMLAKVGELIVLPQGEDPTVATVTDPNALKDQAFFAQAKRGDKVIIYVKAKKAILYDPLQHKIIDVAPINLDPN